MAKQEEIQAVYSWCLKWDEIQVLNGLKNDTKTFKDGLIRYSTSEGHHLPIIFHAVQKDMYMAVDKILRLTKDHYHLDVANRSPMFYTKNKRMAQLLRRHGYGLNHQDREGHTALHSAAMDTKPVPKSCIEMLLSLGANPDVQNLKGETPLHLACLENNSRYAADLLKGGANPNITTFGDRNALSEIGAKPPLFYTVINPDENQFDQLISFLLQYGADIHYAMPSRGKSQVIIDYVYKSPMFVLDQAGKNIIAILKKHGAKETV